MDAPYPQRIEPPVLFPVPQRNRNADGYYREMPG